MLRIDYNKKEGNKMNFYEKKNKKSAFSIKELASLLNVSEEKIKELENGERNISGDTLEEYLKFANMSVNEKKIKRLELLNWFKGVDLKRIREEFGFKRQKDLADEIGVVQSVISGIESGTCESPTFLTLYKLNKFLTNDFNKKIEKEEPKSIPGECVVKAIEEPIEEIDIEDDEESELYTESDLKNFEDTPITMSSIDFISIRRDIYEDMETKIKRYEKIIDYILR